MTATVLIRPTELPRTGAMRLRSRVPDPLWVTALDAAFPPQPGRGHRLRLVWEPGEDFGMRGLPRVVERWFLYELAPFNAGMAKLELQVFLDGPAPAEMLRYDGELKRWVPKEDGGAWPFLNQAQWDIYRETGCVAIPFWVIQGEHGGHPLQFSEHYAALCRMKELPDAAPAPGELPYAPFDQRVIAALGRSARIEKFGNDLEANERDWRWFDRDEARKVREEMLKVVDECFTQEQALECEQAFSDGGFERPTVDRDVVQEYEDNAQRFLETD